MKRRFWVFVAISLLAACGGGGSGVTPSGGPTSSASPTPTPSPAPTASPLSAYCANYKSVAGGVPLNITDNSGLGAVLIVYITNGVQFLDNNGNFTATSPNPYPASCFSTTVGSKGTQPLNVPTGVSGRIYLAYATPNPNPATVPNPFAGATISGPNVGYTSSPFPWDKIEYGTTAGATIDTTQVDALGLPLELSVTGGPLPAATPASCTTNPLPIVGVTSCNYAKIFQAVAQIPQYNQLVVTQNFNGKLIDLQIVAPKDSVAFTSFQWNLFALSAYLPSPTPAFCPASTPNGYLSCVLASYNTSLSQARLFTTAGIGASGVTGHNYCATSDGTSNFLFTDVGSATSCSSATPNPLAASPNPFKMPIQEFTYGSAPASDGGGFTQNILFSQPWGNANVGSGHIFATADAFALWKDLTADLNRGTMLTATQSHPVGLTSPSMSLFFQDPLYNQYAYVIHEFFDSNLAYALAYDDLGAFESGVIWQPGDSINVRINAVPAASSVTPISAPVPVPLPSPTALPSGVGSF
jgi:hypothetical protein